MHILTLHQFGLWSLWKHPEWFPSLYSWCLHLLKGVGLGAQNRKVKEAAIFAALVDYWFDIGWNCEISFKVDKLYQKLTNSQKHWSLDTICKERKHFCTFLRLVGRCIWNKILWSALIDQCSWIYKLSWSSFSIFFQLFRQMFLAAISMDLGFLSLLGGCSTPLIFCFYLLPVVFQFLDHS